MKSEEPKKTLKKDGDNNGVPPKLTGEELEEVRKKGGVGAVIVLLKSHFEEKLVKFIDYRIKGNCFDPESHALEIKDKVFDSVEIDIRKRKQIDINYPYAWLRKLTRLKIIDHFRSRKCWDLPQGSTDSIDADDYRPPPNSIDTDWEKKKVDSLTIRRAFEKLSIQKQLILQYRRAGYIYAEIAKIMGISEEAAKKQGRRAARKFQQILEKFGIKVGGKK